MASPYEVNGTFINEFGVIQRCRKAVEPEGGILPVWRSMKDISEAKGVALMVNNEHDVFEEMKTVCKPLASLHFSDIGEFGVKLEGFSVESSEAKA
jgi:predicted molibdopterin-dependent oxidoreductase YjgC